MVSTLLLSGGVGARSGRDIPKQYNSILGKRIFSYCVEEIIRAGYTDELVIVYGDGFEELVREIMLEYNNSFHSVLYTLGGSTRQESVYKGLVKCNGDSVLLHESARPLITSEDLIGIMEHPFEAVTMGLDIPFTVLKESNGEIAEVLKREELFNVQLPQKFPIESLIKAHKIAIDEQKEFTDDSSLYFHYIGRVAVLRGSHENIKITTPNDFNIAENILKDRQEKMCQ